MAERATTWHTLVFPKGVERAAQGRDMQTVAKEKDFAVKAKFCRAAPMDAKLGVVAEGDITA